MSNPQQILSCLEKLAAAYPGKARDERTLQVYIEALADIPVGLLEQAILTHIRSSYFYPSIAELRQQALRLAGVKHLSTLPQTADELAAQALLLEDAFYQEGCLDPGEWRELAVRFERADRPHRAAHTLEKLRRLEGTRQRV